MTSHEAKAASSVYFDRKAGPVALTRTTQRVLSRVNKPAPVSPLAKAATASPVAALPERPYGRSGRGARVRRAGATLRAPAWRRAPNGISEER